MSSQTAGVVVAVVFAAGEKLGAGNLRIAICQETKKEVVQILDDNDWMCCHNDNPEEDAFDVAELRKDPNGINVVWNNQFLIKQRREDDTYDTE